MRQVIKSRARHRLRHADRLHRRDPPRRAGARAAGRAGAGQEPDRHPGAALSPPVAARPPDDQSHRRAARPSSADFLAAPTAQDPRRSRARTDDGNRAERRGGADRRRRPTTSCRGRHPHRRHDHRAPSARRQPRPAGRHRDRRPRHAGDAGPDQRPHPCRDGVLPRPGRRPHARVLGGGLCRAGPGALHRRGPRRCRCAPPVRSSC